MVRKMTHDINQGLSEGPTSPQHPLLPANAFQARASLDKLRLDNRRPNDPTLNDFKQNELTKKVRLTKVTSPAPRALWRELLRADPEALPTQSPEWLDCLCALERYEDASRFYTFEDGQHLLLPLVTRRGLPSALSVQSSFPHAWGMGGVISRGEVTKEHLVAVFADLAATPSLSVSLLPNPRHGALWRAAAPTGVTRIPRRAHVIDLEGGFEKVWAERFSKNTRTAVRKAERLGVEVESDTTGRLVPIFYGLYRRSIDRWAEQQREPRWLAHRRANWRDPFDKLEHIAEYLGASSRVWVAWHRGQPVAASLMLIGTNSDEIMGAMDKPLAAPLNANDLLQKAVIEDACRAGCRYHHLGESGASVGLARFKERFGAQAYPYEEYCLERFPVSKLDIGLRSVIKRVIGFKDA